MSIFETVEIVTVDKLLGGDTIRWANRDWRVVNTPVSQPPHDDNTLEVTLYDGSVNDPVKVTALASDKVSRINIDSDLLLHLLGE
jgi:hypothetical protein